MEEFKIFREKTGEIGYISAINQSIITISGLPSLKLDETIFTESGQKGLVFSLKKEGAEALVFEEKALKIGEMVARTNEEFKIPVSEGMLGRIINPFGHPLDGLGPILGKKEYLPIKRKAPGIIERKRIKRFLETGVMIVDVLVPIGYGQRELVIGDAKTGKTIFLLQTILNQAKKGVICIYVAIGKETEAVKIVEDYLREMGIFEKIIMVVSTAKNPAPLNYLAPFSGMTIGEYFRDKGNDVLICFDDLTSHAKYYREISLILKKSPGRSAYPGDIFHIQAELLERAGNIKFNQGEKSITVLPVAETLENDISGFIQTNLMAMTDGHIFFDSEEFRKGRRPAINNFLSVSRVGNQTKKPLDREVAGWIKRKLADYLKASEVAPFGIELAKETQKLLDLGKKIETIFQQESKTILPRNLQLILLGLLISGFWEDKPRDLMEIQIKKIIKEYEMGGLFDFISQIERIKNLEELKSFLTKNFLKINEILLK